MLHILSSLSRFAVCFIQENSLPQHEPSLVLLAQGIVITTNRTAKHQEMVCRKLWVVQCAFVRECSYRVTHSTKPMHKTMRRSEYFANGLDWPLVQARLCGIFQGHRQQSIAAQ